MAVTWTTKLKEYVRENSKYLNDAQIAAKLTQILGEKVTAKAVIRLRQSQGIEKNNGLGRPKLER